MSSNHPLIVPSAGMPDKIKTARFKLEGADKLVIALLFLKLFLSAVFFPEMEMPDEYCHIDVFTRYDYHGNLYYSMLHQFYIVLKNFFHLSVPTLKLNPQFHFVSNSLIFIHHGFNSLFIILLRFVHIFYVSLFLSLLYFVLKRIKSVPALDKIFIFRLNLLFLSWSAVSLSLVGISSDFFIYLFEALFFVLLVYYNQVLLLLLINLFMNSFVDNNPIIMIVTTIFYAILFYLTKADKKVIGVKIKLGLVALSAVLIMLYAVLIRMGVISGLFSYLSWIITQGYASTDYRLLKSVACLFLSLYYVGGSMSLLAFWSEYLLFLILILLCLWKLFTRDGFFENRIFLYILAALLTFNMAILTLPAIDQGRYYYFLIPAFLVVVDRYFLKLRLFFVNKYYVAMGSVLFVSSMVKLAFAVRAAF